ncbi:MAG: phosphoribosylformylglycinamidine cyclo-ligase [Eubacteriales bacterium]|nr:phosphoribosylformylglycinamidine cyclo-ligase [Eubacteriales bacterium]
MAISYSDSGVDVTRGYKAVELMKKHVKETYDGNVLGDLGSFGGFYDISGEKMKEPVLVAGCDGVGTKLKYAFVSDKHDTVGIDAVAMCVNDIVCQGARPLFFLDYFATGKLDPEKVATVVKGVADGCKLSGCALIGGETAEMPSFYPDGEYDMAGFAVGIVDKEKVINGKNIKAGDVLIGLESSGVHSNGFSLIRKLFGETKSEIDVYDERLQKTYGEALLEPTRIYVKSILGLMQKVEVKGIAHITGGGFIENIPRVFPDGIGCEIDLNSYKLSPLYEIIKEKSGLKNEQLYNTFNMGIGMVVVVDKKDADLTIATLNELGEKAHLVGKTINGKGVTLK